MKRVRGLINNYKFKNDDLDILIQKVNTIKYPYNKNRQISIFTEQYINNKPVSQIALNNQISKVRVYQILSKSIRAINWVNLKGGKK